MSDENSVGFYTVIENGQNFSGLQDELNASLSKYRGVLQVVGCGIEKGNGNFHAGIEFSASKKTSEGANEIQVWVKKRDNLEELGTELDTFVRSLAGTVKMLTLHYDKQDRNWWTLMVYLSIYSGLNYGAMGKSNEKKSKLDDNVESYTKGAYDVAAYGYSYGDDSNGAIVIKSPG